MFRTPVTLLGVAGVVVLAGSFVPASFNIVSLAQSQGLLKPMLTMQTSFPVKGDRMAEPLPASNRAAVSIVELVGISQATVILRDQNGRVLYRSDPRSRSTAVSKNTDLPVITLKEEMQGPAVQHPVTRREGTEMPQEPKPKRRNPVGCMGDVSPLARASADRMPSLCLANLDLSLS